MISSTRVRGKKFTNIQFAEELLFIKRVSKTVTGGRRASFVACVCIGSKSGYFGIGYGKATEVSSAKQKASNNAKANLYYCPIQDSRTIPHEAFGKYGSSSVLLRPSTAGSGVRASNVLKTILDLIGIKDVVCKSIGSNNPSNVTKAFLQSILQINADKYYKSFFNVL